MLKDYTPLIRQAEIIDIKEDKNVYSEAISILSNNKPERISAIMSDLGKLVDLIVIELNETGTIENGSLAIGALLGLDHLVKQREMIVNTMHQKQIVEETPEVILNREAKRIKDNYKQFFKHEFL